MMVAYCAGLGIPFVVLALSSTWAVRSWGWLRAHTRTLQIIGGIALLLVGFALVTGAWDHFVAWLQTRFAPTPGSCCERRRGHQATLRHRRSPVAPVVAAALPRGPPRNLWRSLTSMRTALALLFLLAVAAIPGALLPQRPLNAAKTQAIDNHGRLGTIMDRLQLFDVFASSWFTAIYALLFVSLVGCLLPRMAEHLAACGPAGAGARNLARMPRHEEIVVDGDVDPEQLAQRIRGNLRGWRSTIYPPDQSKVGTYEVSAEKGYLREFGNLVFHFALLSLLIAVAVGKMWGYEGTRSLVADGEEGMCNTSTAVYDSFRAGRLVDGTDLQPFCIRVDDFTATFLPSGQPDMYTAMMRYTEGAPTTDPGTWPLARVRVNEPLRLAGSRVYVLGNGFARRSR